MRGSSLKVKPLQTWRDHTADHTQQLSNNYPLVGGLEHFLFFHTLEIEIPTD